MEKLIILTYLVSVAYSASIGYNSLLPEMNGRSDGDSILYRRFFLQPQNRLEKRAVIFEDPKRIYYPDELDDILMSLSNSDRSIEDSGSAESFDYSGNSSSPQGPIILGCLASAAYSASIGYGTVLSYTQQRQHDYVGLSPLPFASSGRDLSYSPFGNSFLDTLFAILADSSLEDISPEDDTGISSNESDGDVSLKIIPTKYGVIVVAIDEDSDDSDSDSNEDIEVVIEADTSDDDSSGEDEDVDATTVIDVVDDVVDESNDSANSVIDSEDTAVSSNEENFMGGSNDEGNVNVDGEADKVDVVEGLEEIQVGDNQIDLEEELLDEIIDNSIDARNNRVDRSAI